MPALRYPTCGRADASPSLHRQASQRAEAARRPEPPTLKVQSPAADNHVRVPDLVDEHRIPFAFRATVAAVALRGLPPVPPCNHHHLTIRNDEGWVNDHGAQVLAFRIHQLQAHVLCAVINEELGRDVGHRRVCCWVWEEGQPNKEGRQDEGHDKTRSCVGGPPLLNRLLDAACNDHSRRVREHEEEGQVHQARLRPDRIAEELEHVDSVGVVLKKVQLPGWADLKPSQSVLQPGLFFIERYVRRKYRIIPTR